MKLFKNKTFERTFDRDSGAKIQGLTFESCIFDNCGLSLTKSPQLRTSVNNVQLKDCVCVSCGIGPGVFSDIIVDNLKTNDLLILWCPLFKHVTLKGMIGKLKINSQANFWALDSEFQKPFTKLRNEFYQNLDWALDISAATFESFELNGVPANLVRRDVTSQAVVKREKALLPAWRSQLSSSNTYWPMIIDSFLEEGDPAFILVPPRGKSKRQYNELVNGLTELRQLGVAELD